MRSDRALSQTEFVALIAMLFAMVAFSIDAMLPALPEIAAEVSPGAPNAASLVVTAFVFGMGIGTFFTGPLSDSFGRKRVILFGIALYWVGAAITGLSQSVEQLVLGRVIQGLGVAAPRVVAIAMVRDLYEGRRMAQIMSYAMMVFTLVPAIAPFLGSLIIDAYGWRHIFTACILFAGAALAWLYLRQPETLPMERRKPFRAKALWTATKLCFSHRVFAISVVVQALAFGALFATLASIQPIFDQTYGRGESFPLWFALIALLGGLASIFNARQVMQLGMRRMIFMALLAQTVLSALALAAALAGELPFAAYFLWVTSIFFMVGLVLGNINALAMEPLGEVAGLATSIIGALSTVGAVLLAAPLGLAYDGTVRPLALGICLMVAVASLLVWRGLRTEAVQPSP